ncbi:unnamed protein product [Caenorhabditis bovis]|uniref:GMP synthase (glutamine-hydrolyzing) n=1 Tax=Caenorhabditis bovis TaxID=2654633 RepID=A0A8S1EVX9_9PELO|nr:unnamed protein product [Caenorhabditis bovis]
MEQLIFGGRKILAALQSTATVVQRYMQRYRVPKSVKIGARHSKRHFRNLPSERAKRSRAVSKVSEHTMKRSISMRDDDSDSTVAMQSEKVPPAKRSNDTEFDLEQLRISGMTVNGDTKEVHLKTCDPEAERVAILDFGAQYGKVIDRRVRELHVKSEMFPLNTTAREILDLGGFRAIIISGGPKSVYADDAPQIDPEIFTCGLPVLGICYGFQLMNKYNGGSVTKEAIREDGVCKVSTITSCPLFEGLGDFEEVLLTHGDSVSLKTVAPNFEICATSGNHVAGIYNEQRKLYGVQFHPEVDLTKNGSQMFLNFLYQIADCTGKFSMQSREQLCIQEILRTVGNKKVLVMVSGGVDSTVCAALLNKAIGPERVTAIHIDNGFMRYEESEAVVKSLAAVNLPVHSFNFGTTFLTSTENNDEDSAEEVTLDRAVEPEIKRKIIGNTFIRVKDIIMNKLNLNQDDYFLAQGTLRPDLIESASLLASGHADMIKTHHNDTELVRELRRKGRVIEPLKDFHKDEVRELGKSLGLPEEIVQRHPFPGPGLAIRIICAEVCFFFFKL